MKGGSCIIVFTHGKSCISNVSELLEGPDGTSFSRDPEFGAIRESAAIYRYTVCGVPVDGRLATGDVIQESYDVVNSRLSMAIKRLHNSTAPPLDQSLSLSSLSLSRAARGRRHSAVQWPWSRWHSADLMGSCGCCVDNLREGQFRLYEQTLAVNVSSYLQKRTRFCPVL